MVNDLLLVKTLSLILFTCFQNVHSAGPPSVRTCEPIKLDMCKKIGYNTTGLPNIAGHETQEEAEQKLKTYNALISIGCSSQLQFFLCSVYVPMCDVKIYSTLGPCRRLCETVRDRCVFILSEFGFPWPSDLDCNNFPVANNHESMCMEGPGENETASSARKIRPILDYKATANQKKNQQPIQKPVITELVTPSIIHSPTHSNQSKLFTPIGEDCFQFKFHQQYYPVHRDNRTQCVHGCAADILYPTAIKAFVAFWIAFWATFCFCSSVFTIIKFALSKASRMTYPERAIIYMAINYLIFSSTHLVAILIGRNKISCYEDSYLKVSLLIKSNNQHFYCTITFILLYYTHMSGLIWWLVLSFTFYRSYFSPFKNWSPVKLKSHHQWFHLAAWVLPAFATVMICMFGDIGADELTGNCYVGNNDVQSLLHYVIIPTSIVLSFGLIIIIRTIIGYFKHRRTQVDPADNTCLTHNHQSYQSSSEKISYNNLSSQNSHPHLIPQSIAQSSLMDLVGVARLRLFLFQSLYFAISIFLLFVSVYEYLYRDSWYSQSTKNLPNVEIMSLKIFMSFLAGLMTGIWIWMSDPYFPCVINTDWNKESSTSPTSLTIISQHNHHSLPVTTSSFATLNSSRCPISVHRGGETSI